MLQGMQFRRTVLGLLTVLLACSCSSGEDASGNDCAGAPFASGYTLSPGPRVHEGPYTASECRDICGPTFEVCAPTVQQGSQPRYRCGTPPPLAAQCGAAHEPRVVEGNADGGQTEQ